MIQKRHPRFQGIRHRHSVHFDQIVVQQEGLRIDVQQPIEGMSMLRFPEMDIEDFECVSHVFDKIRF